VVAVVGIAVMIGGGLVVRQGGGYSMIVLLLPSCRSLPAP